MRRRIGQSAPQSPKGIKLVDDDGHEYPCVAHYVATNDDGIAEWAVVAPVQVRSGMSVRVALLPPRTSLVFVGDVR